MTCERVRIVNIQRLFKSTFGIEVRRGGKKNEKIKKSYGEAYQSGLYYETDSMGITSLHR